MKRIFYLFFVAVAFFACSKDSVETVPGGITGSVSDKTTGEPVATVNVSLSPGGQSTVTGSDGSFSFEELNEGTYVIAIRKEGYLANDGKFSVVQGKQTPAHLLIERIPAVVTTDPTIVDFGSNASVNTLSFKIVNSSYENLAWEIEHNCPWIQVVKPKSGTLEFGKTETIVVVINRDLLDAGENKTVLVVKSTNGSSQVEVKAVGEERVLPKLNTLVVTDITRSSATLSGEIISTGRPAYTERGFVYNTEPQPTLENTLKLLTAPVTDSAVYSCHVDGLSIDHRYYVRAYAKNSKGVSYASNEISFVPSAVSPQVLIRGVTDVNVSDRTAVLHGRIDRVGEPAYTERGFVYGTISNPTVENTKVVVPGSGTGDFSASIAELSLNQTYYVRAYAMNEMGVVYSSSENYFTTQTTLPQVSVQDATDIKVSDRTAVLHGTIIRVGEPAYTERGFVYGTISNPTVENTKVVVMGSETGAFSASITELSLNQTYYVRGYAMSEAGIVYSSTETSFTTTTNLPEVSVQDATDINVSDGTAVLHGTIISVGDPAYTERGFVYGTISNPTVENTKVVVTGSGTGAFSTSITELSLNQTYYVRGYAMSEAGIVYSSAEISFTIQPTLPEVSVQNVTDIKVSDGTAVLHGTIVKVGDPAYTERGFVYGTISNPTVENTKVVVTGSGMGVFSASISELSLNQIYYVRTYVKSETEYVYSSQSVSFILKPSLPVVSINTPKVNISDGKATLSGKIENSGIPVYRERGFVYSVDNRTPNVDNSLDTKIVVDGIGPGDFAAIETFPLDQIIYVRAYAINEAGISYSSVYQTSTQAILPQVKTLANTNIMEIGKITFNGEIISIGEPAYTECGFVWGLIENPTIGHNKVVKQGLSGTVSFSADVTLPNNETIYMRAYAMNRGGVVYAKEQYRIFPPWRELEFAGIAVQSADLGTGDWDTANNMCKNSRLGNYTDWRLPTKDELAILYSSRYTIGNFSPSGRYWSSSSSTEYFAYQIYFSGGKIDTWNKTSQLRVRCVRILK